MPRPASWFALVLAGVMALGLSMPAAAHSRIKDIVEFEGVRDNMLVGYGIVVGLNGTGDSLQNAAFTKQSLSAMLERLGVNVRDAAQTLNTKNVAAAMATVEMRTLSPITMTPETSSITTLAGESGSTSICSTSVTKPTMSRPTGARRVTMVGFSAVAAPG